MADVQVLVELQDLVIRALSLADGCKLHDIGISLDGARLGVAERLRDAGEADRIVDVAAPERL